MIPELLNRKELAALLARAPGYVSAMKRAGFREHVPGKYRYADAVSWLKEHPEFKTTDAYPCKRWKTVAQQQYTTPSNT